MLNDTSEVSVSNCSDGSAKVFPFCAGFGDVTGDATARHQIADVENSKTFTRLHCHLMSHPLPKLTLSCLSLKKNRKKMGVLIRED